MDDSTIQLDSAAAPMTLKPDNVRLRRWFAVYGVYLLAMAVPLVLLVTAEAMSAKEFIANFRTLDTGGLTIDEYLTFDVRSQIEIMQTNTHAKFRLLVLKRITWLS